MLHPSTTVFPSVAVSVAGSPLDKLEESVELGSAGLVPVGVEPGIEVAPAMILLASSGLIVAVEEGEDESDPEVELGGDED